MDAVLGLSMTSTTVRLQLVEGEGADGVTIDHDSFEMMSADGLTAPRGSEDVVAAVLGTQAIATAGGHQLHSIGVTWSHDADNEAALLLDSLGDLGFDTVVAVPELDAAEALAQAVGHALGFENAAVCVVEPEVAIVSVVETHDGAVLKVISRSLEKPDVASLPRQLTTMFQLHHCQPERVFVVGSGPNLDEITRQLAQTVPVPVIAPADAELALARGAALASAQFHCAGRHALVQKKPQTSITANVSDSGRHALVPLEYQSAEAYSACDGADQRDNHTSVPCLPSVFVPRSARMPALKVVAPDADHKDTTFNDRRSNSYLNPALLTFILVASAMTFVIALSLTLSQQLIPKRPSSSVENVRSVAALPMQATEAAKPQALPPDPTVAPAQAVVANMPLPPPPAPIPAAPPPAPVFAPPVILPVVQVLQPELNAARGLPGTLLADPTIAAMLHQPLTIPPVDGIVDHEITLPPLLTLLQQIIAAQHTNNQQPGPQPDLDPAQAPGQPGPGQPGPGQPGPVPLGPAEIAQLAGSPPGQLDGQGQSDAPTDQP